MLRTIAAAAVVALLSTSAFAAECTQAEMDKMQASMKQMPDKAKQEMAMSEMKMAGDMMAKKDMAGCTMHMDKASKAMDMKK